MGVLKPKPTGEREGLAAELALRLVGQPEAIDTIVPFIEMHQAGLSPEGRPIGVVLLLGPTGTGKTHTVEALAEVLHGSPTKLLKVDCAEFQYGHEIAKLIGSPPGYLGHKETQPLLNQNRLNDLASERSGVQIVLFDEIEKAHDDFFHVLLGILDKATLTLGCNTAVTFEQALIFMTSNLGAKAIQDSLRPAFGFERRVGHTTSMEKVHSMGMNAARTKFPPEFLNRIDSVLTYKPLERAACEQILQHILVKFSIRVGKSPNPFGFRLTDEARSLLIEKGVSSEFGARELKRMVQKHFVQPVASLVARNEVPPLSTVVLDARDGEFLILVRR